MGANGHHPGEFVGGQHGTNWEAATESLGGGEHVRRNAIMHIGIQLAGAANPGLDLIENQHRVVTIAQFAQPLQEGFIRRQHAALALHGLDDHRTGGIVDQLAGRLEIVIDRVADIRRQRRKVL